jgi:hypothetical protein
MGYPLSSPWRGALLAGLCAATIDCREPTATLADLGTRLSVSRPDSTATLIHETWSGFRTASRLVVTDALSWGVVWHRAYATVTPQPPQPVVNFATEAVIVVSLGERFTGGFDIRADSIVTHDGGIAVYLTTVAPGARCVTTQSLTQPVHAVRVPRPHGPAYFDERPIVRDCP